MTTKVVIVPLRGLGGKSRLGMDRGGPFNDSARQALIKALIHDIHHAMVVSSIFNQVALAVPNTAEDMLTFARSHDYATLPLKTPTINEQLWEIQQHFRTADRLLILASDLPLVTPAYLQSLDRALDKLCIQHVRGAVINCSRGLGSATIYLSPPDAFPITLGVGKHNLLTQFGLAKHYNIKTELIINSSGFFDLDEPADVIEVYYLLQHLPDTIGQHTRKVLIDHKWQFLLPAEPLQLEVTDQFVQLLRSYTDEQIRDVLDAGLSFVGNCVQYFERRDDNLILYVCTAELLSELMLEIAERNVYVAVAYTVTRDQDFEWHSQHWTLKIAGYGVPCDRLGRAWLSSSAS